MILHRLLWRARLLGLLLVAGVGAVRAMPADAQRFTTVDGLPSNVVHAMLEDRHGYLWFASDDGLARYDGRRFRTWRMEQGLPDNQVLALARDDDDQLWLGTSQGQLVRMSADRHRMERFDAARFPALAGVPILVVRPGPRGEVWLGTDGAGLFRLDRDGRLRQFLPTRRGDGVPDHTVEHLQFGADGSLWVGTPRGLARWQDGRFAAPTPSLLARAPVTSLVNDRAGGLWVGSAAGPWRATASAALEPLDLSTATRALGASRRGGPWLADGAMVWRHDDPAPAASLATATERVMPRFRAAFEDRHGGLWLLGHPLGVWRLPPHWQHFVRVPAPERPPAALGGVILGGSQVQELQCAGGSRWTFDAHAVEWHPADGTAVQRWPWSPRERPRPVGPQAVHCDGSQALWWGGRDGLRRWSAGRFQPVPGSDAEVNALHVADDGALWVANPGVLRRYRVGDSGVQHSVRIDARHGLPAVRFNAMSTDTQGALWATSARGLVRVQPREGKVRVYTRTDGVPAGVYSAPLQSQGRHLLARAADGTAVRFDPAGLGACHETPAAVLDRVQLHREGRLQVLPPAATLHFQPSDRDIQLTVRRLGPAVDTLQYRFRLHGLDPDWIRVGRRGTRGFAQLPPGTHRLEFQARQVDGHWSASQWLDLVVARSGWHHPLVVGLRIALGGALLGAALWAAQRRRARVRARQMSAQRRDVATQSAQAKERYMATLGHEVRTPLTGVLGLSELLLASPLTAAQRSQIERIRQGGQTLLHVLNRALDEARIEAGCMPVLAQSIEIAALCRQWHARTVVALCQRGTGVSLCLHLAPGARVQGDPARFTQMLDSVVRTLATRTASAGLVLQVGWQPGRQGLLLELTASGKRSGRHVAAATALPTPSRRALQTALGPARGIARALGGTLQLRRRTAGSWQVLIRVALPELGGSAVPAALRVLLVDADPATAAGSRAGLQAQGHAVVEVAHALAALAELQARAFDLVMVALDLPGVGGLTLLEMLRAQGIAVPVLATIGLPADLAGMQAAVAAAGGQGLLCTPACPAALRRALWQAGAR